MNITHGILQFSFLRKQYEGMVSMFMPQNRIIIRVYVECDIKGLAKEQVFIYYKMEKGNLYWLDLNDPLRQQMAKVIAKKLLE